jgi:hypothetical protein
MRCDLPTESVLCTTNFHFVEFAMQMKQKSVRMI